jgi:hypothetical protein
MHTRFWWGNIQEKEHFEDISVCRIMILKCMVKKEDGRVLIGFFWLKKGFHGGTCECGNETSVSIKCWELTT